MQNIIAQYRREVIDDPKRLPGQIADEARKNAGGSFGDTFRGNYKMTGIVFSIGDTTIKGEFSGRGAKAGSMMELTGAINFELVDAFKDPLDIGTALDPVVGTLTEFDRYLRDRIYNEALRRLRRRNAAIPGLNAKDLRELPGGSPYVVEDKWNATFSAKVSHDKAKSRFTRF